MLSLLPTLGYLSCVAAITPAVAIATAFCLVEKASSGNFFQFLRFGFHVLDAILKPWKLAVFAVVFLGILSAGCFAITLPWACLTLSLLGILSFSQIFRIDDSAGFNSLLFLFPSLLGTLISGAWAWILFKAAGVG